MSKPERVPSRSIEVTSSSPAPRSTARSAQATASRPVASRPPLTTTSQAGPSPGRRRASIATTTAWRPNRLAQREISAGSATAAVLSETLSAPARRTSRISSTLRTPPPTVSGMNARRAVRSTMSRSVPRPSGAAVMSRKTSSSAPSRGVALGELGRVALVDEVDEAGALDDAAVGDVEARDHAAAEHQAAPQRSRRRSWRAAAGRRRRCARGGTGRRAAARARRPRRTVARASVAARIAAVVRARPASPAYEWTK